ncbi:MAG: translation initiation factor IF-2 [Nanoarchaeota archaeon]|nr:translation initiation factor IF-2 [Nanoarchaeota archaeon]MBU4086516.1 translation initiation factor IF-2 [Nanoarchaeota archaeon]
MIRQPIVTVCGHVDHGKTSILDKIRGSSVAAGEAGGITQKISFTLFPAENIKKGCWLLDKHNIALKIPGFLFIDTPGHAAFTNLRKRGGSLADLAILVIDINEGIKPQTSEVLSILKANKTPFIIALNKIDNLSGWRKQSEDLKESIESQAVHTSQDFQEKLLTFQASLHSYSFNSDLYFNVKDFTKKICLVPVSARTGEGIPELLMMLCGVSQKFLTERLSLAEKAKGLVLEVKQEKTTNCIEAILYDGKLRVNDEIVIATFQEPLKVKIRSLEQIKPLSSQFQAVKESTAATGLRVQLSEHVDILPGMPFQIFKNNMQEIAKEFKKDLSESIKTDSEGIIVKADSLGSLEALLTLLKQENIRILKASIGKINKQDIQAAKSNAEINPLNAVVIGFNTTLDKEADESRSEVKIIDNEVVYKLIEDLKKWQEEKRKEIEKAKLMKLTSVFKLQILPQYVFHNAKPAIFGVKVLGGRLKPEIDMITKDREKIGRVKKIQHEQASIEEASEGMEVAISVPGITFDRQLKNIEFLYSDMGESQFREFKKNKELLSQSEMRVLQELAEIKRKEKVTWGV